MPGQLREAIIASGNAGTSGQSFRNHVTGAVSGAKLSDYKLTAVAFSGQPTTGGGPYPAEQTFAITATFTRNSRAHNIQRNVSAAWQLTVTEPGTEVALESFSSNGSPSGASHTLNIRVKGKQTGSPSVSPVATQPGSEPASGVPWAVQWTCNFSGLGGTGTTAFDITWSYDPDTSTFSPTLTNVWSATFGNRGYDENADFDFEWRTADSGGGTLISTARQFTLTSDSNSIYPSDINGLLNAETATLYLRWRIKTTSGGNGTWNNYGAVACTDPRPGA